MEWANSGELLAVAGISNDSTGGNYINMLHFYNVNGVLRFLIPIPCTQVSNTYIYLAILAY